MNDDQIDLAHGYALGILEADEQRAVAQLRSDASFNDDFDTLVRQTRETLTAVGFATVATPPPGLRERLLAQIAADRPDDAEQTVQFQRIDPQAFAHEPPPQSRYGTRDWDENPSSDDVPPVAPISMAQHREAKKTPRWRLAAGSIAAAVALLAGGIFIGNQFGGDPSLAEQVVAAGDVRAASYPVADGGTATAIFSKEKDAAVLLMDKVAPPKDGSVYQMWFITGNESPVSAGLLDAAQVAPGASNVVQGLGTAGTLALTVEPSGGSTQPTTTPFIALDIA